MDDQTIETKRRLLGELKQFARAEMARDLAKRHGRDLRLPWDPEDAPAAAPEDGIDMAALGEIGGN